MNSKICILTISVLTLCFSKAAACGGDFIDGNSCNYFCLVQPLNTEETGVDYVNESTNFWYSYLSGALSKTDIAQAIQYATAADYQTPAESENALVAALYKRSDSYALNYLRLNNRLYTLNTWMNSWDYEQPSPDQYSKLADEVAALKPAGKLAERTVYLKMRALFCAKRYDEVEANWKQYASKWTDATLKRRAQGYLAGVYYQRGNYVKALEIYDALGDERSINKCVSRLLDPDKLEQLYEQNKDSKALGYVMQDYANYLFHAMNSEVSEDDLIWLQVRRDYQKMLTFAQRVVKEHKVKDIALWQDFVGFIYYAGKEDSKAYDAFEKALTMKGTQAEMDFARQFKFLASFNADNRPANFTDYFLAETEYILKFTEDLPDDDEDDFQYSTAYLINTYALPTKAYNYCESIGNEQAKMLVLSIFGTVYDTPDAYWLNFDEQANHGWSADKIIDFYNKLKNPTKGDRLVAGLSKLSPAQLTVQTQELIGTKLMREGRFDEAIEYLDGLPTEFLKEQGIAPYLNLRKMSKRDFEREDYDYMEGKPVANYRNVKLEYCREMAAKKKQLAKLKGNQLADLAYELANKLFQASPAGDLWAISDYYWSGPDIHYNGFNKQAIEMLRLAIRNTSDFQRLRKCYYGLAAVPQENAAKFEFDWSSRRFTINPTGSEREGYEWLSKNLPRNDAFRRSCDWLNLYIASK